MVNKKRSGRINSMLNDDLLGLIFKKIKNIKDRDSFSEVCKQWLSVRRLNTRSVRGLLQNFSVSELTRFPNLIDFRTWMISRSKTDKNAWNCPRVEARLISIAKACPKLETFMVDYDNFAQTNDEIEDGGLLGTKGLHALANGCPKLSTLMFSGKKMVGNPAVHALCHSAHNLKALCLRDNGLISDRSLRAIGSSSISNLELVCCRNVTDVGLGFLANGSTSKTLKRLVIEDCPKISGTGMEILRNICSLEHLALSCRGKREKFTDTGMVAISAIRTLKELRLRYMDLSDHSMAALAKNCSKLETLDLECCRLTGAAIRAFSGHKTLKLLQVIYGLDNNFEISDVECVALGCPSLKSFVLDEWLEKSYESMHENARRIMKFECMRYSILPPFSTTI